MPISLLSVIAKTLEMSILPYLTANTHTQHGYKTQHYSDGTTHSKQYRSKGVQPNDSPCANNHCSIWCEQNWYSTGTIIKLIANYIKGRKAYTTYRNHTSLITSIQNWRSTRWRPFTNIIQHVHCRHTTTKGTSSGHGIRRRYYHHIYTHKHECSQEIHSTIPT